jgi:hypothetical protein
MIMQMLWRRKDIASVPRDLGFMRRVEAKVKQPHRKQVMETRDLSQPSGWEVGWPDAPRARKIVLPGDVSVGGVKSGEGWKRGGLNWHTSLHGHEAAPGIVGAAVAETGYETACYDWDICVRERDLIAEVALRGL